MRTVSTSEKYSCALPSFNRRCDRRNICAHHDSSCNRIKKLGLHYIDFSDSTPRTKRLTPKTQNQNYQFRPKRDELGLGRCCSSWIGDRNSLWCLGSPKGFLSRLGSN